MLRTRAFSAALVAASLGVASYAEPARADSGELPVAVLTIGTLDAFEQADALTSALKKAVEVADGWTYAQLPKDQALLFLTSSLSCNDPPDAECEQKIGDELKVDHFVWGTIKRQGNDVVGELHLWSRGKGSQVTQIQFPVSVIVAGDQDFVKLVLPKFEEIAGPPPPAKVTVRAGSVTGTISVDGKQVGKLDRGVGTLEVGKGTHRIVVKASGYEDMEASITVSAMETREVKLLPIMKSKGPDPLKILGFTAIGAGVAAAGVATYAGVRVMQINGDLAEFRDGSATDYQFRPPAADGTEYDGCDPGPNGDYPNLVFIDKTTDTNGRGQFVRDKCSEGRTMQTLTLAMWPVAGVLAGTGIILLATADWKGGGGHAKEKADLPFLILPSFGPGGADITFSTKF